MTEFHLRHGLIGRVSIDHEHDAGVGGEVAFGDVVAARRVEAEYHRVLGEEDPQPPAMADLPFLFNEDQPTSFVGLRETGLRTVCQQGVVDRLEERLEPLHSAVHRARREVQPEKPPVSQLPFDRLMAKEFAEQNLDPD